MTSISIDLHSPPDPKIGLMWEDLTKTVTLDVDQGEENDERMLTVYFENMDQAIAWLTSAFDQVKQLCDDHSAPTPKLPTHLKLVPK